MNEMKQSKLSVIRENTLGISIDGKTFVVLEWNIKNGKTAPCPFCGRRHNHGIGDGLGQGHCISHCPLVDKEFTFQNGKGQTFTCSDGYVLSPIEDLEPAENLDGGSFL